MRGTLQERFSAKFKRGEANECWEWNGAISKGYGSIGEGGQHGKILKAHVVAWELHHNQIVPDKMCVRHTCDNPSCVNPAHLVIGTHQQNMRDMTERGRHGNLIKTHCPNGHEYNDSNTYFYKTERHCKTCKRERQIIRRAA